MAAILPCAPSCCSPLQVVNVPGISGSDGIAGQNGINAYTTTTAGFTVPGIGAQVGVSVANSSWTVPGQVLIVAGPANFLVSEIPNATSVTLTFLGYPGDVVPGTVIGSGNTVSPAGLLGGGWNVLSQKQDQAVINSAALINSANLQFTMLANTNYRIRGVIFFDTTAAGAFKYAFTAPAAPTLARFERTDAAAGQVPVERAIDTAIPGSTALTAGGASGAGMVQFDAIFQNGVNGALFAFQFAQNSATADTGAIIHAGSYFEWSIN